jgi:hypothetical protein
VRGAVFCMLRGWGEWVRASIKAPKAAFVAAGVSVGAEMRGSAKCQGICRYGRAHLVVEMAVGCACFPEGLHLKSEPPLPRSGQCHHFPWSTTGAGGLADPGIQAKRSKSHAPWEGVALLGGEVPWWHVVRKLGRLAGQAFGCGCPAHLRVGGGCCGWHVCAWLAIGSRVPFPSRAALGHHGQAPETMDREVAG